MSQLPDHVGIDFGNHSVKAVELAGISTPTPRLVNFGSQATPHGVINSEDESHQRKLADVLKELWASSRIANKQVVMALPEFSVFTRFVEFVGIKDEELQNAVFYEAKRFLPIPVEDVQMSFVIIGYDESRSATKVLVVAAPRKTIDIYRNVVEMAGLEPIAIETESVAMGRAMFRATKLKQILMLDFGSTSTDMSIMNEGALVFSQSISIGSDSLTQAIVNQFNFEYTQAEEYKRNYGLDKTALEGKILNTLKPIMDSIVTEVQRGIEFYKTRTLLSAPKDCILSGDGALLPGLSQYMADILTMTSSVADPWQNISVDAKFANIIAKSKPSFAVSVGLALKDK